MQENVLPYRASGADIAGFIDSLGRGRSVDQAQATLNLSSKSLEGTLSACAALGLVDDDGALTTQGRRFALARQPHERQTIVLEGLLGYEPYELLLEALVHQNAEAASLDWVITWWGTHGYGSSQTNRSEGASTFARLVEFAGIGEYKQGRRGHPSRIEWVEDATEKLSKNEDEIPGDEPPPLDGREDGKKRFTDDGTSQGDVLSVRLPLSGGNTAEVAIPNRMLRKELEKVRSVINTLLEMVEIQDTPPNPDHSQPTLSL